MKRVTDLMQAGQYAPIGADLDASAEDNVDCPMSCRFQEAPLTADLHRKTRLIREDLHLL